MGEPALGNPIASQSEDAGLATEAGSDRLAAWAAQPCARRTLAVRGDELDETLSNRVRETGDNVPSDRGRTVRTSADREGARHASRQHLPQGSVDAPLSIEPTLCPRPWCSSARSWVCADASSRRQGQPLHPARGRAHGDPAQSAVPSSRLYNEVQAAEIDSFAAAYCSPDRQTAALR